MSRAVRSIRRGLSEEREVTLVLRIRKSMILKIKGRKGGEGELNK